MSRQCIPADASIKRDTLSSKASTDTKGHIPPTGKLSLARNSLYTVAKTHELFFLSMRMANSGLHLSHHKHP